jgi:hypothetical protein
VLAEIKTLAASAPESGTTARPTTSRSGTSALRSNHLRVHAIRRGARPGRANMSENTYFIAHLASPLRSVVAVVDVDPAAPSQQSQLRFSLFYKLH